MPRLTPTRSRHLATSIGSELGAYAISRDWRGTLTLAAADADILRSILARNLAECEERTGDGAAVWSLRRGLLIRIEAALGIE